MILAIVVLLVLLTILVLIHEFGHFLVAKKFGIKVEEFAFGFPPRIWGKKHGETVYAVNWFPIGGYVKLYGEDDAGGGSIKISDPQSKVHDKDLHRAFFARPAWQRALVVVAGVVMNFFLAVALSYIYLFLTGFKAEVPLLGNYKFSFVHQDNFANDVTFVEKNSPADRAGMRPPIKITEINGKPLAPEEDIITIINKDKGRPVMIDGENLLTYQPVHYVLTPRVNPPKGQGPMGVQLDANAELSYQTFSQKLFSGFTYPVDMMAYNLSVMKSLITYSIQNHDIGPVSQGFAGPVGIYRVIDSFLHIPNIRESFQQLLNLTILLSISLAFFNILPIPALDGGRFFFIVVELVTHKKISPRAEAMIHTVGFVVLIGLIILITANDINNLLGGIIK